MGSAIKQISIARGHDVTRYTLACFGGAGGQHACLVADALGMTRVMIHPLAGVLSAYGMGRADMTELRQRTFGRRLEEATGLTSLRAELAEDGSAALLGQGVPAQALELQPPAAPPHHGTHPPHEVTASEP